MCILGAVLNTHSSSVHWAQPGWWGWETQPSALGSDWGCRSPDTYISPLSWASVAVAGGRCSTDPTHPGELSTPEDLRYISVLPAFLHSHPILPLSFFLLLSSPGSLHPPLTAPVFPSASFSHSHRPLLVLFLLLVSPHYGAFLLASSFPFSLTHVSASLPCLSLPHPPGPLRCGSDDSGVLVSQPLRPPHCSADQEDTTETQQQLREAQSD